MTLFREDETDKLLSFIGYGNLDADVWFLGMEEGGGDIENLRQRLRFNRVEDLRRACVEFGMTDYHMGRRRLQPTWSPMCEVMLTITGSSPDVESKRTYQAEELGRKGRDTLLLELMPLPKPNLAAWPYADVFPRFPTPESYYEQVRPKRIECLRHLIKRYKPRLVIAYGMGDWSNFKQIFPGLTFGPAPVGSKFECAVGVTSVILTPHFVSFAMNGQVPLLARLARQILGRVNLGDVRGPSREG